MANFLSHCFKRAVNSSAFNVVLGAGAVFLTGALGFCTVLGAGVTTCGAAGSGAGATGSSGAEPPQAAKINAEINGKITLFIDCFICFFLIVFIIW